MKLSEQEISQLEEDMKSPDTTNELETKLKIMQDQISALFTSDQTTMEFFKKLSALKELK